MTGQSSPTRRTVQRFVTFCQRQDVCPDALERLRRLYTGPGNTLEQLIARLELRACRPQRRVRRQVRRRQQRL